ncbi:Uncharacterised protein [Mycoplasmopsis citelli]|uniref:Uncharacterized protein n=1 Tax=Mycoplasmopsis citelli TaxID=171281 RepID=A0A449B0W2_9BACT|nr:hypothetical protein [Mycoplasmopsis citelli]VEU74240.1 Uncharacterised protein [Mycoplasmopsis citelli]
MKKVPQNQAFLDEDEIEFNMLKTLALNENVQLKEDLKWLHKKFKLKNSDIIDNNFKVSVPININQSFILKESKLIEKQLNHINLALHQKELFWFEKSNFSLSEFNDILKKYLVDNYNPKKNHVTEDDQNLIVINKLRI